MYSFHGEMLNGPYHGTVHVRLLMTLKGSLVDF